MTSPGDDVRYSIVVPVYNEEAVLPILLTYKPKYSLDDGIHELIKGYRMIRDRVYGNV